MLPLDVIKNITLIYPMKI